MSSKTLTRRASDEERNTYWLEHKGVGFVRVHTCALGTRKVDPELVQLAAAVEYAPELLEAMRKLEQAYTLKAPHAQNTPELQHARQLLIAINAHNPEPQP